MLRCPRCGGALREEGRAFACPACALGFPVLGGVPCLLPDPPAAILRWRAELARLGALVSDGSDRLLAAAATAELASTRARLERLRRGQLEQLRQVEALFAEAGLEPRDDPRVGHGEGVLGYFHQIHRDWGWPTGELEGALAGLAAVLEGEPALGLTLVLGAGAARLTRELRVRLGATRAVALDVNPLPFFIARKLLDGATVELTELPSSPRTPEDAAVLRSLGAGLAPVPDVALVLADGLAPPLAPGVFDTVVTPWFMDQIAEDAGALARVIHGLLRPGGLWLDHGPFVYPRERPIALRYTERELLELVAAAGFTVEATDTRRLVFMESPACNQGRSERVLSFRARREARAPVAAATADWLADGTSPVPRDAIRGGAAAHPFFAAVAALVDGQRSADDIAAVLAASQPIPLEALRVAVRACLADLSRR